MIVKAMDAKAQAFLASHRMVSRDVILEENVPNDPIYFRRLAKTKPVVK